MTRTDLIRNCVQSFIVAIGFGLFMTLYGLPWLDAHRRPGDVPMPLVMYVILWLLLAVVTALIFWANIDGYLHPELEEEEGEVD